MSENEFLQGLSDPITVALGMAESALLDLERGKSPETIKKRLESARNALSSLAEKVAARRRLVSPKLDK